MLNSLSLQNATTYEISSLPSHFVVISVILHVYATIIDAFGKALDCCVVSSASDPDIVIGQRTNPYYVDGDDD